MKYHGYGRRIVSIHELKKISTVIIISGFLLGIIYVNLFVKKYILSLGIFSDYFLEEYIRNSINTNEYMLYIAKIRLIPVLILIVLGNTRFKRISGSMFLLWTGCSAGMVLTTAILKMGIRGILLCMVGILPHFICYIAAYCMVIVYLLTYPNKQWDRMKIVSLILFMLLGIISECYINPVLMDIYINHIL